MSKLRCIPDRGPPGRHFERRSATEPSGKRWQERWLAARFPWYRMSEDERRALPDAQALYEIDARWDSLSGENKRLLRRLSRLGATSLAGVERKLAVAAGAIAANELTDEHRLLRSAIGDLGAIRSA